MSDDSFKVRKLRQADYIFWLKKDDWDPANASILLAGYEPEEFPDGSIDFSTLAEDVDGIHRLIIESINSKQIPVRHSPADWIAWFKQTGLPLPPVLIAVLLSQANPEATAAPVAAVGTLGGVETAKAGPGDEKPWLVVAPEDPRAEQPWYTPARYFARQLVIEKPTLLANRGLLADKVSTALFNAGFKKRGDKIKFDSSTVLKAFTNVTLG